MGAAWDIISDLVCYCVVCFSQKPYVVCYSTSQERFIAVPQDLELGPSHF